MREEYALWYQEAKQLALEAGASTWEAQEWAAEVAGSMCSPAAAWLNECEGNG